MVASLAELIREWSAAPSGQTFKGLFLAELGEDGDMVAAAGHVDRTVMADAVNAYDRWLIGTEDPTRLDRTGPDNVQHLLVAIADDEDGETMVWWAGRDDRTVPMTAVIR